MIINILAFGQIADICKKQNWTVENVHSTDDLITELNKQFPSLNGFKFSVAVNKNIIKTNTKLTDSDVVALLPPFSGG